MMNLERHIEILLLDNDCVIVPEFGAFIAHRMSARYEEAESLFLPPHRTLGFNPHLRLNDSLLAQSYADAYDISYPEALRSIAAEVEELKQQLTRDGEYQLNNLGTIRLNAQGLYHFMPCEAGILTPATYALNAFEMKRFQRDLVELAETDDAPVAETVPMEPRERGIFIKYSTIRGVAAACIAVLAIWLFPSQFGNGYQQVANTHFNTELLQRIMPKDVIVGQPKLASETAVQPRVEAPAAVEEAKVEENIAAEAVVENAVEEKVEQKPASSGRFTIVLASHVSQPNADYFVKQMQQKGFSTTRTLTTGTVLRVVYGGYQSEAAAYDDLKQLREADTEFAEAWVLSVE